MAQFTEQGYGEIDPQDNYTNRRWQLQTTLDKYEQHLMDTFSYWTRAHWQKDLYYSEKQYNGNELDKINNGISRKAKHICKGRVKQETQQRNNQTTKDLISTERENNMKELDRRYMSGFWERRRKRQNLSLRLFFSPLYKGKLSIIIIIIIYSLCYKLLVVFKPLQIIFTWVQNPALFYIILYSVTQYVSYLWLKNTINFSIYRVFCNHSDTVTTLFCKPTQRTYNNIFEMLCQVYIQWS